ncbi:MAG: putative rRNA maturation factor [Candidatus Moranbacteria bacterium GW2011_GWC2_37_8]|nr:MAG: putative rRNA maturation factor [Candidatus Moranbacteria bacterium GW2011_GWC2_37_8]KKQ60290.1 MAG: putative rRNA maturation factor [Parcubacteria group bacterium GW2011_GWC1_38_22]KKQ80542.1 MAG: putative rRNA maturation factor [Candidatus Moranbacteria bacterium GW2011_GWD2_38_7]
MKLILEINNKTPQKVVKKTFLSVFGRTLDLVSMDCLKDKTIELSVALVGEEEMHSLNLQYRKKDKATDVLSFSEYETTALLCKQASTSDSEIFLGEIILCPNYIANNAHEDGEAFEYALNYIISHGILHLLGFPHGKKMFSLQRKVADMLK